MPTPSPSRRRLQANEDRQFSLPLLVEGESSASSSSNGQPDSLLDQPGLQDQQCSGKANQLLSSNAKELREQGIRGRIGRRKPVAEEKAPSHAKLQVSRDDAAEMLSISVRAIDYLISTKQLSTRRIGSRVLIPIEDVRKFAYSDHPQRLAG